MFSSSVKCQLIQNQFFDIFFSRFKFKFLQNLNYPLAKMDLIQLHKVLAIKKSKKHQVLDNFSLYTITFITCSVFCSSPFWFPSLMSSIKLLISVYLPKIGSFLLNPKLVFVVGNLIIVLLLGESKFFSSNSAPTDVYYNEFIKKKSEILKQNFEGVKVEAKFREEEEKFEIVKGEDLLGEDEISLPAEELNKRADDFIARVNRQRMQEARLLS